MVALNAMSCMSVAIAIAVTLLSEGDGAKWVDAGLRAKESVMNRRRFNVFDQRTIDDTNMSVDELLQLTKGESMVTVNEDTSALGTKVVKLQEEYEGIQVFDGIVTIRKDSKGRPTGDASGRLVQDIAEDLPDVIARLTNEDTLEIAIRAEGDRSKRDHIGDVSYKKMIFVDERHKAHLANLVMYLIDSYKRPNYIIDLKTGQVLVHWNALDTFRCTVNGGGEFNFTCGVEKTYLGYGGNEKMGRINYGAIPYCLNMTVHGDRCYLENEYVRVVDMGSTMNESIQETASFNCLEGYLDKVNQAYSPALDAFFYGTMVGKMFEDWFESQALREKIVLRVHWGYRYENAFWNGANTTFGDGAEDLYPLTVHDIVGHEVGHGVTEFGSGLVYYGEPGGINEAFSDILGEASEQYFQESDLFVGSHVMKSEPWMRSFESPEEDGLSIRNASDMTPYMDPHFSSGVYRRAFYVTVKEEGFSIKDATSVYLHANRNYWHPMGTFYDCSCGVLKSAIDLGFSQMPFKRGFSDVGIETCDPTEHIFTLSANETETNVKVSSAVHSVFRFETGWWMNKIFVEALAADSTPVGISVQEGYWVDEGDTCNSTIVAAGVNSIWLDGWIFDRELSFQLSTTNDCTSLVEVTAGYTSDYF